MTQVIHKVSFVYAYYIKQLYAEWGFAWLFSINSTLFFEHDDRALQKHGTFGKGARSHDTIHT